MIPLNSENKGDQRGSAPDGLLPVPPGMDLMEYLDLKEKAESYIRMVRDLYLKLAFAGEDPAKKEAFENEKRRHTVLLKSMKWMDMEMAKPIAAEYPELIRRLRDKEKRGKA